MFNPRTITLITMILAAAATRVLPHPWNFTAVGAMCLFGGATFQRRSLAFIVPLLALFVSDLVIAFTTYDGDLASMTMFKYSLFGLTVLMGMAIRERANLTNVLGMSLAASVMFFLLSNGHYWYTATLYPHTPEGLLTCYIAAIPFAQNMLYANVFYSVVLFGGLHLLQQRWPALANPFAAKLTLAPVRG